MKKKLLISAISLALVLGFMISAFAAAKITKQLTAEYTGINITLDGKKVEPKDVNGNAVEPFIVDGTTYLPVRALSNALGLDVDWDGNTQTVILKNKQIVFDAASTAAGLEVKTYTWKDYSYYAAYEITNTSMFTINISIDVTLFDADGTKIGSKSDSESCVPPGQTVLLHVSNSDAFAREEHTVTVQRTKYNDPVSQYITATASSAGNNKMIVTAKNVGLVPARFVTVTILFFKDGKPIDMSTASCYDNDYEIKPGAEVDDEVYVFSRSTDYDSYKLYITGYADMD